MPISSLTASGNRKRSFFDELTQNSGFSPGIFLVRATVIIPILGCKSQLFRLGDRLSPTLPFSAWPARRRQQQKRANSIEGGVGLLPAPAPRPHASAFAASRTETAGSRYRLSRRRYTQPPCNDAGPSFRAEVCLRRKGTLPAQSLPCSCCRAQLSGYAEC